MSGELIVLFTAMLPIAELRLAIPLGIGVYNMSAPTAFCLAVLGNIIPVIFILWLLEKVYKILSHRFYFFNRFFAWLFERTQIKHSRKFKKFRDFALVVLVAVPLPFTGAWTGALAAFVFGVPIKRAFFLILLGVLVAGIIVTCFTQGAINLPIFK